MQTKSSTSGSTSPAPSAGGDPRESELLQLLNAKKWLNGSRKYRHQALAQFISKNTHFVRQKLQQVPALRQQFFSALAGCELDEFKILIKFIAQSRILVQELKTLLTDIMNKNAAGYSDRQWNTSLFRSTLAAYLVQSDTIAHALLTYSNLPSTDPAFMARVLLNKIGAPTIYFTQIDSLGWHFVNFLKGLVEFLLPSFLFSFKNPPIPSEVLACIEEAPRDLPSAKAEASSNAAKISITFNTYGWSQPEDEQESSQVSSSLSRKQPSSTAKQLTTQAETTFQVAFEECNQTFLMKPAFIPDPDERFGFPEGAPSPIKGKGSQTLTLHTEEELDPSLNIFDNRDLVCVKN